MNSDTDSLAFIEEDDVSPPPQKVVAAAPSRPRIVAMPAAQQPTSAPAKAAPAKPPLHHAATPPPAPVVPARASPAQKGAKAGKADNASEFSDNESVMFSVENNSMVGTPQRGAAAPTPPPPQSPPPPPSSRPTLPAAPQRRLTRAVSNSSIQFQSEPGSRANSPGPKGHSGRRGSATPAEKTIARATSPTPAAGGKSVNTNDSITFLEQSDSSDQQQGTSSPRLQSATVRGVSTGRPAAPAAAFGPRASMVSNDSIAFQVEESSTDIHAQRSHTQHPSPLPPLPRMATAAPTSVADTSHNEFVDNSSIAFEMDDEAPAPRAHQPSRKGSAASPPKRTTGTPYYNSHSHRSTSQQSQPGSRPPSPSIQFEFDNETALEQSHSQFGGGSPPLAQKKSPANADGARSPGDTSLPQFLVPDSETDPPESPAEMTGGGRDEASEAGTAGARGAKKTIISNHLQRRQRKPSRLPSQPQKALVSRKLVEEGSLSGPPSFTTHPPLYQKAALSTPIAAQAASVERKLRASTSSAGEVNMPKRKDPSATLQLHPPQQQGRRSKESASTRSPGLSPNAKLFTEAGSTGTTDSPPDPPHTGRHSRTSTDIRAITAQSPSQSSQREFPMQDRHSHPSSVMGYLENQEMENRYHRNEYTQHLLKGPQRAFHAEVDVRGAHGSAAAAASMEAAMQEAEQWRHFNEQQRGELMQLRRRIAQARREDRTLLQGSPIKGIGAAGGVPRSHSNRGGAGGTATAQPAPIGGATLPGWSKSGPGYSSQERKQLASPAWLQAQLQQLQDSGAQNTGEGGRRASPASGKRKASPGQQQRRSPSANNTYATGMNNTPASARLLQHPSSLLQSSAAAAERRRDAAAPASPAGTLVSQLVRSAAAASVADMLGVLWPPHAANHPRRTDSTAIFDNHGPAAAMVDLYFVNGSRLTPAQVERFLDLVRVQTAADAKSSSGAAVQFATHMADMTLSPRTFRHFSPSSVSMKRCGQHHADVAALDGADGVRLTSPPRPRPLLSAKLAALLPRKVVRRSRVMREVFDVMDLKRQGSLALDSLPALTRLFEGELEALEHARTSLLRGKSTPLATLLESAVASRQQYATTWGSGGGGGRCRGEYVVDSGSVSQELLSNGEALPSEVQADLAMMTHRLLLLSFAVNVVIPIASASRIPLLDFATLCMILYAAVDNVQHEMDSPQEEWREVVQQYFMALDS